MKKCLLLLLTFLFLSFTPSDKQKQEVAESFISFCKTMNSQLPARVDEMTVLESMVFYNWTLTAKYKVELYKSDLTDNEWKQSLQDVKAVMKKNIAPLVAQAGGGQLTPKQLSEFYNVLGFRFKALYTDLNGEVVGAIILTPKDFDI